MKKQMTDEEIRKHLADQKRRARRKRRRTAICAIILITVAVGCLAGSLIGIRLADRTKIESIAEDKPLVNTAVKEIGSKGGEKFWKWFGFGSRVEWCACFASWCEDQCGMIDAGLAPKFAIVSDGSDWLIDRGQWIGGGETPEAGDLIFFDWEQDKSRDHVGIVSAVIGNVIFTVEGNSSDLCRFKRYYVNDPVIYGYGRIPEPEDSKKDSGSEEQQTEESGQQT